MTFSPSTMAAPVGVGDVIAEKYEVTKVLGVGGMGVVVAAWHLELDKLVALKFMHDDVARGQTTTDRFLREARAAARLTNEHIGRVLDVGRLPGGIPYIVMEYLEGRDLQAVLAEHGPLEVADACEYVLQVCEAMAEAHAQGIIHRDLKPENLFLTTRQDGRPLIKVLDFGISKAQHAQGPTGTHTALGTPTHMSPEQMRSSRTVDARADIWSLGVILYQLLSQKVPFWGDTITETMLKVINDPLPSLAAARPGLPPALVAAVEKCLEKNRDRRFDNVAELAHELIPFAPERARAAMSLIERVMTSKSPVVSPRALATIDDIVPCPTTEPELQPRRGDAAVVETSIASPAAAGRAAPPQAVRSSIGAPPSPPLPTTLGAAVGQSLETETPGRGFRRWRAPVAAIAVAAAITVFVVRSVKTDAPAASPPGSATDVGSSAIDAATSTGASSIVGSDGQTPDRGAPAIVDAAIAQSPPPADAAVVDAAPHDARTRVRPSVDAGVVLSIDAAVWTPEPPRMEGGLTVPR
jgi:serine/threonine-protein kinase